MRKLLLLITVLAVVGLVGGCAAIPMFVESDILSPKMEERKRQETERRRRETERISKKDCTLWVLDPEGNPGLGGGGIRLRHSESMEDELEYWRSTHESSEPDGFRGIKFGTDISTLKDMEFMRERIVVDGDKEWKTKVYIRKNEIMMLGDTPLSRVEYFFWEGKFVYAELVPDLSKTLLGYTIAECSSQFGRHSTGGEDTPFWVWKKTIVGIDIKVETTKVGEGDLWEAEQKASFAAMPKDMTWEETKFMYKTGIDTGIDLARQTPSKTYKEPPKLRIMIKEAAEHLGYRVKVVEKKEKGGF